MYIPEQLKVLLKQQSELGTGLDALQRNDELVRDEYVCFMGPDRLFGSQSFEAIREDCRELKLFIEDSPVGQQPLLEHLILAILFFGARRRRFVDVLK